MSTTTTTHTPVPERSQPPMLVAGPLAWMRANLFSSVWSSLVTLALAYFLLKFAVGFVDWAFLKSVWTVPMDPATGKLNPDACRQAKGEGACWAVIWDKYRFILFGRYPYEEQWRAAIVLVLFLGLFIVSAMRRFWRPVLALIWVAVLTAIFVLMWGGVFGLRYVAQDEWGGLPITLILSTFGLACAFPIAVLVALGRRSTGMPAVKMLCVIYIEVIRGVPLISLLFMASVMFPLFMPVGLNPDKLLRAQVAIILFAAVYLAEVIRGGLQALPKGQYEAADALGLSYWKKMGLIILPQALRLVIPPLVNTFIGFFKDTSLVLIIGIFDLLTAGKTSIVEPAWQGFGIEVYVFVGAIYLVFCFAMSKYSQDLERELNQHRRR